MSNKSTWVAVCDLAQITPATGVCALVKGRQVAIFRPADDEQVFAIDNMDPFAQANVLSRGIICQHQDELWVASPLKKQRFNLQTGRCLESDAVAVEAYQARVNQGQVEVQL